MFSRMGVKLQEPSPPPNHSKPLQHSLAWIGRNFAKGILTALAAVLVSAVVALLVTDQQTPASKVAESSHRTPSLQITRIDSWPNGVSAWTVIFASEATKGLAESAVDKAKRVPSRGLNLGVLYSSNYMSLRPGYWVAFAGQFDSVDEAQAAVERYQSQFPTAYQRFIEQR